MKFIVQQALLAVMATGVNASPYLEYCKLFEWDWAENEGFAIRATCGFDDKPECFELNISHCIANAYGELWPAMQT
jgi:hypothetical protein